MRIQIQEIHLGPDEMFLAKSYDRDGFYKVISTAQQVEPALVVRYTSQLKGSHPILNLIGNYEDFEPLFLQDKPAQNKCCGKHNTALKGCDHDIDKTPSQPQPEPDMNEIQLDIVNAVLAANEDKVSESFALKMLAVAVHNAEVK